MKKTKNTDVPQLSTNWKHVFLVVLHFIVFIISAVSGDFRTTSGAARALP